jgi:hypothetical protein
VMEIPCVSAVGMIVGLLPQSFIRSNDGDNLAAFLRPLYRQFYAMVVSRLRSRA